MVRAIFVALSHSPVCRTLNRSLLTDQQKWRDSVKAAEDSKAKHGEECEKKIAEMEAQVRDLMFHFETQQKVEGSSQKAELQVRMDNATSNIPIVDYR